MHPELFGYLNEIPKSLGEFRRLSGKAKLSAEILTSKEMTDLRRELADSQMQRQVAAGLKPVRSAIQVDHGVPCWTTRSGLQQLFGPRRLEEEELDDADALWLYEKAKKLHNSDLNARAMTEVSHRTLPLCAAAATCSRLQPRQVRNQFFIPVSVLLGQGRTMADVCIRGMLLLSQEGADRLQLRCLGCSGQWMRQRCSRTSVPTRWRCTASALPRRRARSGSGPPSSWPSGSSTWATEPGSDPVSRQSECE
jgi:hypothetical protein